VYLSLIEECRRRVERALGALAAATADAHLEMKLPAALGASLGYIGDAVTQPEAAWTRTLDLARSLGKVDYQLRALWGLAVISERETLTLAQQFAAIASTPADRLIGDQMIGQAHHFRGNQSDARRHLEHVVANRDLAADRVFPISSRSATGLRSGTSFVVAWSSGACNRHGQAFGRACEGG
jgi:hypothetical protein